MVHLGVFFAPMLWQMVEAFVQIPTVDIAPGVHMPVISIGTGGLERNQSSQIVANWLKLGGRGIDTAIIYHDEQTIPEELAKVGIDRKDVFITTKIPGCDHPAENIEFNLKKLNTDYIDLLLIHRPQGGDCDKAWRVFEDYHRRGAVKAIGVSHYNKSSLEHLLEIAAVRPAVNQIELNVLHYDSEAIAFAKHHNITTEAFSPLGRAGEAGNIGGNRLIKKIAVEHNVSSYQVALKWILQHGHIATFQSTSEAHQASDADIFKFELTKSEMAALDVLGNRTVSSLSEIHI